MDYLILALATWRLTSLIVNEDGPFDMFSRFRVAMGIKHNDYGNYGENVIAKALACFWCASVWVAIGVYVLYMLLSVEAFLPFALSAIAILLDEFINDAN